MSQDIERWKTLKSDIVFDHKWYTLRRDHVELPTGQVLDDYFVSVRRNVALTFALTDDNHVLLVRQYKHAAGEILIELPGGLSTKGKMNHAKLLSASCWKKLATLPSLLSSY